MLIVLTPGKKKNEAIEHVRAQECRLEAIQAMEEN